MQHTHFVIPNPEAVPQGLARAKEILHLIETGGFALSYDLTEAKSLATVACLILEDVLKKNRMQKTE